jgi:hypothetical protein
MRELSHEEIASINGGNIAYGALQIAGAYYTGYAFGGSINSYNQRHSGMSLGQAIYYSLH